MSARQIVATFLALILFASSSGFAGPADPPPPPPGAPPAPLGAATPSPEATPARVSYINGEVAFWRPGAEAWAPTMLNTPLAPGDALATGAGGNVEVQIGPRAFVRAAESTQIGLDGQEPDVLRLRVTAGHAALDFRELAPGQTVELETPNAVIAVARAGYYHVQVAADSTAFATYGGGSATLTPVGGATTPVAADQQVVIAGVDAPRVWVGAAPPLGAWDRWNYARTDALLGAASARYVGPGVYGADALDQYGRWRTVDTYGAVWVPTSTPTGWVPYSTGRWIHDPRFGWTWLDDAPWGWAPYHYGRWVFVGSSWAWAPGPIIVRPAYSPALVVFLGGASVSVGVSRPLCWAPLGWGEPVIPWWGRAGFIGVTTWRGWGGPRVVDNVVVNRTTVNVTSITVYRHVHVTDAVVGVPADRFARGHERPQRFTSAEVRQLTPVRGALDARPVSVAPALREPGRQPTRTSPTVAPRTNMPFSRATTPAPVAPGGGRPAIVIPEQREPQGREAERRQPGPVRARDDDRRGDRQTASPAGRVAPTQATPLPDTARPERQVGTAPPIQTAPAVRERRDTPSVRHEAPPARQAERPAVTAAPAPATRQETVRPPAPGRVAPAIQVAPRQDGGQRREREPRQGRAPGQERNDRQARRG
ncbi:MAG: DUF6600 domain-containing protein [Candidatus Rokuibacteriota bacterium]